MTLTIDITYQAGNWDCAFAVSKEEITTHIHNICARAYAEFDGDDAEVSIVLADNAFVQGLNKQYRAKDTPTNVLSFPASDEFEIEGRVEQLGDVIIALETVNQECSDQDKTFYNHFTHLVVHGMLHLLGLDHIEPEEAEEMESLEIELLKKLGVDDPYTGTDLLG